MAWDAARRNKTEIGVTVVNSPSSVLGVTISPDGGTDSGPAGTRGSTATARCATSDGVGSGIESERDDRGSTSVSSKSMAEGSRATGDSAAMASSMDA